MVGIRIHNPADCSLPCLRLVRLLAVLWPLLLGILTAESAVAQSSNGGISGMVTDREFEVPLGSVTVRVLEANVATDTDDFGHFVFHGLRPGAYTLTATKPGFQRVVRANVVVTPGSMSDAAIVMPAEYADMQEMVVRPLNISDKTENGADLASSLAAELGNKLADQLAGQFNTEIGLLNLRAETSGIMDAVGSEMMSKAGAGNAAEAMKLVAGATVADDKYAVIRGLSDRFVNTQVNGIIMPTADPDVRAVQLDLFPSALLESIRVYKTFTPDLPGNTSGGSIDIVTPDAPKEFTLKASVGTSYNTETTGNSKWLTSGQKFDYFGLDPDDRKQTIQSGDVPDIGKSVPSSSASAATWQAYLDKAATIEEQTRSLSSVMAPTRDTAPMNHKWSATYGDRLQLGPDTSLGWLGSFTYSNKYSYQQGVEQDLVGGTTQSGMDAFDVDRRGKDEEVVKPKIWETEKGTHTVGWGLGTVLQLDHGDHSIKLNYLRTQHTEEEALRYVDTVSATTLKCINESLIYTARDLESLQLVGRDPIELLDLPSFWGVDLDRPRLEWSVAHSTSTQDQPDRRFFLNVYKEDAYTHQWENVWGDNAEHIAERAWRTISEESDFYRADFIWPFTVGPARDGELKLGLSNEDTFRTYTQDSFWYIEGPSLGGSPYITYEADFSELWSEVFLDPERLGFPYFGIATDYDPTTDGEAGYIITDNPDDVDYEGTLRIPAWYWMGKLPVFPWLDVIGGARVEQTMMNTNVHAAAAGQDDQVRVLAVRKYVEGSAEDRKSGILAISVDGSSTPTTLAELANASIDQTDVLPSIGLVLKIIGDVSLRGTYSHTIGRPTFKEITPVSQQDRIGGQLYAGNPTLVISQLENYDLRLEWNPGDGRLLSLSAFRKDIQNPIDNSFASSNGQIYVIPFNYSEGSVEGLELEARYDLGRLHQWLEGFSVGGNYTLLDATVTLPETDVSDLVNGLESYGIDASDVGERRMKDQPDNLLNLYLMYESARLGTSVGLFANYTGETLLAGEAWPPAQDGSVYIPNLVKKPYTSLDIRVSQKLWKHAKLTLSAENILNPVIEEVWQSDYVAEGEVTARSYKKGITFSISLSGSW